MTAEGLSARGLHFGFGRRPVLRGVDLELAPGEWVAVLGPNGCGKSTLVGVLGGLLEPSRGEVRLEGRALGRWPGWERGRTLGILPQQGERPPGLSVVEVVGLGRLPWLGLLGRPGPGDSAAVDAALARTEVTALRDRSVEALSGGELQRVLLARALAAQPRYLLLDEPTNHLDLHHQAVFLRLLRSLCAEGVGVLTVLHDPNLAAEADRIVLLAEGQLAAAGRPDEVLVADVLRRVYGEDVVVEQTHSGRRVVLPGRAASTRGG